MSRVQLALNVRDLAASIDFYTKLLATEPVKVRPGYANFVVADPPLKLILIEQAEARGTGLTGALNHLGVEVETADEVAGSASRLSAEGLATDLRANTTCCYAVQDKVWVDDPDSVPWEIYTVLADSGSDVSESCAMPDQASARTAADRPFRTPVSSLSLCKPRPRRVRWLLVSRARRRWLRHRCATFVTWQHRASAV